LGGHPEILDHYKILLTINHRAKFHANRPMHLEDLAFEIKKLKRLNICGKICPLRKLLFPGGL